MSMLTTDGLKMLMEKQAEPCISIFMPTHRMGTEAREYKVRLKNLLREVEEKLSTSFYSADARQLLQPAQALLQEDSFWRQLSDGLAIFLSPELFTYYRLPLSVEESVVVGRHFHIRPVLPLFSGDGRFYVLAISQNQVRLLRCSRYSVHEVELKGMPRNLAEAVGREIPENQFHAGTHGRIGKREFVFHGADAYNARDDIVRYLRQIDEGLHKLLHQGRVPLVLAGVGNLFPIYREVNTYPYLMEEGIPGNPEELSAEELRRRAWTIMQPYFQRAQKDAAGRCRQLLVSGQASSDINEVVPAAYHGRVELVFVAIDLQRWGTFDPSADLVHIHQKAAPGDVDLLDFVAVHTILSRGTVYAVNMEEIPGKPPLAAVFRY